MKSIITIILIFIFSNFTYSQEKSNKAVSINDKVKSEKIEVVNKSFDELVKFQTANKKEDRSIWDTLIPLLIGAGLTLITQVIMDQSKNRKEKKSNILLTKSELEKLKYLLKDNYRELAMHKAHKNYWYAHFEFESQKETKDEKQIGKFYNYHINSSSKVRETENKIADNFAEYCKQTSKLQYLTKFNENVKKYISEYQEYKPEKPKHLITINQHDLYDLEREEENRLLNEYQNYIQIIEKINNEFN